MIQDSRTYIVYLTPQDYKVGEAYGHTPQHLTLVPPLLANPTKMIEAIKDVAKNTRSFSFDISSEGLINPEYDTEVYFVEPLEPIKNIHLALLKKLEEMNIDLRHANWIGREFKPHIAKRKQLPKLAIGQKLNFDNIAVIQKYGNVKTIIDIEKLK